MGSRALRNGQTFDGRFIPNRKRLPLLHFNINRDTNYEIGWNSQKSYVNHGLQAVQKASYQNRLALALGLPSITSDVIFEDTWPVKPRKLPCIKGPKNVESIENLSTNLCDWSPKGTIAAIIHKKVYWWQPDLTSSLNHISIDCKVSRSIKHNTTGDLLALGLYDGGFIICCLTEQKVMYCSYLYSLRPTMLDQNSVQKSKIPKAMCFEWLHNDILLVGCSDGSIVKYDASRSSQFKHQESLCYSSGRSIGCESVKKIISMKKSCYEHYLACSTLDHSFKVFSLINFDILFHTKVTLPLKSLAWHPWRECIIATPSDAYNGTLKIWNIINPKNTVEKQLENVIIDALTFNQLSGELVVSCFSVSTQRSYIRVMSSFKETTELIEWDTGRIPILLWSSNHKYLLAAGASVIYSIFSFFEEKEKKSVPHHTSRIRFASIR